MDGEDWVEVMLLKATAPATLPKVLTLLMEPSSCPISSFTGSGEVGVLGAGELVVVAGVVGAGVVGGVTTGSGIFTSMHSLVFNTLTL